MEITFEDYEAFIFLARKGATTDTAVLALENFLKDIEKRNGITRYFLWIRWQEAGAPIPAGSTRNFPTTWPPTQQFKLEQVSRPIARTDVEQVVSKRATKAIGVLVTRDPNGQVGWSELDGFFP